MCGNRNRLTYQQCEQVAEDRFLQSGVEIVSDPAFPLGCYTENENSGLIFKYNTARNFLSYIKFLKRTV